MTCTIGTLGESGTDDLVVVLRLDAAGPLLNVGDASARPTPGTSTTATDTDDADIEVLPGRRSGGG